MDDGDTWDWIPHVEGADRQQEINDYLRKLVDALPLAGPMIRYDANKEKFVPADMIEMQGMKRP